MARAFFGRLSPYLFAIFFEPYATGAGAIMYLCDRSTAAEDPGLTGRDTGWFTQGGAASSRYVSSRGVPRSHRTHWRKIIVWGLV